MYKCKTTEIKVDMKEVKAIRKKVAKQMKNKPDWYKNALNSTKRVYNETHNFIPEE